MSDSNFTLTPAETAALRQGFKYCPRCASEMVQQEIYGRVRSVCPNCGFIQFLDPKVSAAVMAVHDGKVLFVQRTMEPAKGSWCFPGGFMELWETPQQTAVRECKEESGFEVEITRLVDVFYYEDYRGSGVLIMYQGQIAGGEAHPGEDAAAVGFFSLDELPPIEFDSNLKTLKLWQEGKI